MAAPLIVVGTCPFWKDKSDNVVEQCTLVEQTNDFLFHQARDSVEPSATQFLKSTFAAFDADKLIMGYMASSNVDAGNSTHLWTLVPGQPPEFLKELHYYSTPFPQEITYPYVHLSINNNIAASIPIGSGNRNTHDLTTWAATFTSQDHDVLIGDLVGGSYDTTIRQTGSFWFYDEALHLGWSYISGTNKVYALRSSDGVNWTTHYIRNIADDETYEAYIHPNENIDDKGFLFFSSIVQGASGRYCRTSYSADGITWVDKGNMDNGQGNREFYSYYNNNVRMFYRSTSGAEAIVIGKFKYEDNSDEVLMVFDDYGQTFLHEMANPQLVGWDDPGDHTWHFTVDPATNTLFSIVDGGNFGDWSTNLFKSSDWGATWEHVTKLHPIEFYSFSFTSYFDYNPDSQDTQVRVMVVKDGYLVIASPIRYSENEGDASIYSYGVMQFDLAELGL